MSLTNKWKLQLNLEPQKNNNNLQERLIYKYSHILSALERKDNVIGFHIQLDYKLVMLISSALKHSQIDDV